MSDNETYCYCKHCLQKLIPHKHLYFFEESVGGWHLAFEFEHNHPTWYIGPNPKVGKYLSPNKVFCTNCKKGIGNEVLGKLPSGNNLFSLDREDVAINQESITHSFSKKQKWKFIHDLFQNSLSIRVLNTESPELLGKPAKPVILVPGEFRDTQISATINVEIIKTRSGITPKQYQVEALSESMARNIILVLPTGMGKTLVSILLMQQTSAINQPLKGQRKRMVLFLVTTLPLVRQQTKAIEEQCAKFKVMEISSEDDKSWRREIFEDNEQCPDVLVMTQGSFFNVIKCISLASFHLIIFDEAHHATGDHAFARVMKDFYEKIPHNLRPKILGLTASPSSGQDLSKIERKINKLEEVLHAHIYRPPSLPQEIILDAEKLFYVQTEKELRCQKEFIETFNDQLCIMQQNARYSSERLEYKIHNLSSFWTELVRFRMFVEDSKINLGIRVGDMFRIFEKFILVQIEGYEPFVKYLKDDLKCSYSQNGHNTTSQYRTFITRLIDKLVVNGADTIGKSTKYTKMVEQLETKISTQQSLKKFRGIVFVKTRDTCKVLLRRLKKESINEHLNVQMVVGHSREDGMNTEQQAEVMSKFESGQTRLVVATSVIEEGIDVQGCNFVLCFENDFNIRSLIQRRGRARNKEDGSFMVLMNKDDDKYLDGILQKEKMMNHIIRVKMQSYMSEQKLQADIIWREHFELSKYQPLGSRESVILNIYNSDSQFDDTLQHSLGNNVMGGEVLSTHESRKYLKTYKEYLIGFEDTPDSIKELRKALYSTKGWWAKVNNPLKINLPDHYHDRLERQKKPPSGAPAEAFNSYFSAGNFTNPTKFVCKKNVGLVKLSYDPAERMLEVELPRGSSKFQFKKENFDSFCLYDCDPMDNEYHTLYLIVKRPPVIIKTAINKENKRIVLERQDRRSHPFVENSFVYSFKIKQFLVGPFISALQIPYYMASILASDEQPLPFNTNSQLSYLFAVLQSNKFTGFGKTDIPQAFIDRLSDEFDKGNIYSVDYLIDEAIDLQEFNGYDHLINMDLSLLSNVSPNTIPKNHVLVKSAYVTPSRVVFNKPRVQLSNRCLRLYGSDRFMTVQFTEEDLQSNNVDYQDLLKEYYQDVLTHGIHVPGLGVFHYLGNSNSQARSCMSWFYCVENSANVEKTLSAIRKSLIGESPKWTPRKVLRCMALVFPSTIPTIHVDQSLIHYVEDIEINGHNFTEGTGYIGQETAKRVCASGNYPSTTSAFQIRLGGSKGVLSVHPTIREGIFLRDSMNKFKSNPNNIYDRTVEVISVSGPKTCYLNRQIINLFNGLGVPSGYFLGLQQEALNKLTKMFNDPVTRKRILRGLSWIDNALDEVDLAVNDPLIGTALQSFYMKELNKIQDKCYIPIENARTLMGISDESGQLKPKQVFVQISHQDGRLEVIIGKVLVCKNPCLHPGDVRVLEAVSLPALENVYTDVIAFSQQGEVPSFKECSGSDLDGDRYFVWFDKEMVGFVTEEKPFLGEDLQAAPEKIFHGTEEELIKQYLININKGVLGQIALSHMALCDMFSPTHLLCIKLAEEHFKEVDSIKTGVHGEVPLEAKKLLQDFNYYPHFMESSMPRKTYWNSNKVLGKLFQGVSILKAIPQFIPQTYVVESHLVNGYEEYLADAISNYQRYKYEVNSLLKQYDLEKEEDILVDFIKETLNSFHYHQLYVHEIRKNYQKIHHAFKNEFLREFPGVTVEEKQRCSNHQIERKVSAWYYASHSDVKPDHTLSFFWIVKGLQPKRELKSGLEKPDYMSQSIIDFVDENKSSLIQSYSERILTVNDLARLFRNEGGVNLINSKVLMFGSSSMLLFDPVQSDLDLYIRVSSSIEHHPILKSIETILQSSRSTAESIKYCQNLDTTSAQPLDADNIKYIKNTAVPIVRFQMNKLYCDITVDPNGIRKTAMMCNIFYNKPMIFPVLFAVIRWGRETGLVVKQLAQTNSRNIKTWSLVWLVMNYFKEKGLLDLSKINLDAPVENMSVEWWIDILERSHSCHLGYYLINFFEYYSQKFASILRNKEKGERLYLVCPLDKEHLPSVDINPKLEEEHTVFLQEIFTIAHHTLASSGNIKVFLRRCLFEKKKIINLDKMVSRHIRGSEAYIESKISMVSNVDITIYEARRGCLQVKISGDPSEIQRAMNQFHLISADVTTVPFRNAKKYVSGGGTVLLYKGSNSMNDTLSLVRLGKEREKLCNIQHLLKNPRMQGILKNPEEVNDQRDLLYNAKLEYQKALLRQLKMCNEYTDERKYGRKNCLIRLGHIYLFNCPYEGAEMTIEDLQKAIAKSRQRSFNLNSLKLDPDEDENEGEERKKQLASTTAMRQIERSNKSDNLVDTKNKKKTKLPKSSFYPSVFKLTLQEVCKLFEDMGWTRDDDPEKLQHSKDEAFILCCKSEENNMEEFKVSARSNLELPNVIKHRGLNWFACDLTTYRGSHPEAHHLDVRYCIQSKRQYIKKNNWIKQLENKPIARKRENDSGGRLAPIELTKEVQASTFLIRHHAQIVYFKPPKEHPMCKYNLALEIHSINEYRNTGDLYFNKVELELNCDLPSDRDTLHFSEEYWKLGVDTVDMFNKILTNAC